MEQTIHVHIPYEWVQGIPQEELTLQHIFRLGLYQYRVEHALNLYRSRVGSLGYIAEQTNLPKRDLIREARLRGIEPDFSEQTLLEEVS